MSFCEARFFSFKIVLFFSFECGETFKCCMHICLHNYGKRSELQKSERRKPKRTPKTMLTITTSKRFIKAIRTSKSEFSERRKANYHNVEKS
jgi:hypothetical protein